MSTMRDRLRQFTRNAVSAASAAGDRAVDFESGTVPAVISTSDQARDGARILQDGWELTNYRQNPVVLYNHDDGSGGWFGSPSERMPIATSSDEESDDDRTIAVAHFDLEDDFARRVLGKVQRNLVNATSVRWLPLEHRVEEEEDDEGQRHPVLIFVRQELLEWSFVSIPADPGAVILRADGKPLDARSYASMGAPTTDDTTTTATNEGDAPSLIETLDAAHALLESLPEDSVLTEDEEVALGRVYGRLCGRLGVTRGVVPASGRDEVAAVLNGLAVTMRKVLQGVERQETSRIEPERLVAEAMSKVTGRTAERIYQDLTETRN